MVAFRGKLLLADSEPPTTRIYPYFYEFTPINTEYGNSIQFSYTEVANRTAVLKELSKQFIFLKTGDKKQ